MNSTSTTQSLHDSFNGASAVVDDMSKDDVNLFAHGVRMVGQVKLGPSGRGKHAQDVISRTCRKRGFAVAIRHLLADKELERTFDLFFSSD
jgi:hypothetical protein